MELYTKGHTLIIILVLQSIPYVI